LNIEPGTVPCIDIGELSELARREAEYAENAVRRDFTWQENVAALEALSALRSAQAVEAGLPPPTLGDLSLELRGNDQGGPRAETRKELIVAQHLDDPDIAAAKSVGDAYKLIMKKERGEENLALAATLGATLTAVAHTVLNEDSVAWMERAEPSLFDIILTDPPYGMGADDFGDSGGRAAGAHGYVDSVDVAIRCMTTLFTQGFRITKPLAHLYMFLDIDYYQWAREEATRAGWRVHRTPLIWHKPSGSRMPWPQHGPQRRYEIILYAVKGDKPIERIAGDVLSYSPDDNLGHAAQKPAPLFIDLLSRSARPGMHIFDPFCGTGTTLAAAAEMRCFSTSIELDPASYAIAAQRAQNIAGELA
jgi:site-specific DNA-methyltransferase (adenine-specific)